MAMSMHWRRNHKTPGPFGGSGIGKRELRKQGIKSLNGAEAYLAKPENAGRHLGKKTRRFLRQKEGQ